MTKCNPSLHQVKSISNIFSTEMVIFFPYLVDFFQYPTPPPHPPSLIYSSSFMFFFTKSFNSPSFFSFNRTNGVRKGLIILMTFSYKTLINPRIFKYILITCIRNQQPPYPGSITSTSTESIQVSLFWLFIFFSIHFEELINFIHIA